MVKVLILGDIIAESGLKAVIDFLKIDPLGIKPEIVIANAENAHSSGAGLTSKQVDSLLNAGVDVITLGNHVWDQREFVEQIDKYENVIRPANMHSSHPGKGYFILEKFNFKTMVINLIGNLFIGTFAYDPFEYAINIVKQAKKMNLNCIIVDFHGETSGEKVALAHILDGEITCLFGTHTHCPTADLRFLEKGTLFQTDVGMCGIYDSVIGFDKINAVNFFLKKAGAKRAAPAFGNASVSGLHFDVDANGRASCPVSFIYPNLM